ncbi:MAG: glycoside hydrolase family 28 protein [Chloroflexia bacterium]|nr:glycoside hydrolase family 28 protein [Chloroflexia bacterium]
MLVPKGTWLTGAIHLKSNVNLNIHQEAEILFSTDTTDYMPLVFSRWEGTEAYNFSSLIYANGQENIAVTGKGMLNGQGHLWHEKYKRMDWRDSLSGVQVIRRMGEQQIPVQERLFGPMKDDILYPSFIHLINCNNILLEGFTINKGPYWTVHPTYSKNLIIRDIRVETFGQANGDGINPDACENVLIEHCILNTGDDALTLKSGRDLEGRLRGKPTENVVIRHCVAEKGHGGVAIGSEMSGGIRNVYVHDCEFKSPLWGIYIKSMRGRGNVVENIWFENIKMDSIQDVAMKLSMYYHDTPVEKLSERTPIFRNIHFSNIDCKFAPTAIEVAGLQEMPISNVTFSNINVHSYLGIQCLFAHSLSFNQINISASKRLLGKFDTCRDITFESLANGDMHDTIFKITNSKKEEFHFGNTTHTDLSKVFFNH